MRYSEQCKCCNHRAVAYTVNLNKMLAETFIEFVEWYLIKRKPINFNKEMDFTHTQKDNFYKLKHLGIVHFIEWKGWIPTTEGLAFYWGVEKILNPGAHMNNETLGEHHEAWNTHKQERKLISLRDVMGDYTIRERPDYKIEASGQSSIF